MFLIFCYHQALKVILAQNELNALNEFRPSRHLLVQSQHWKQQNNMRNLIKVNKDTNH